MMSNKEKYLRAATTIGVGFVKDAFWDKDRCNWMSAGPDYRDPSKNVYTTLGPSFYDGTSGIAFYLLYLYSLTGDVLFKKTAMGALNQVISRLDRPSFAASIGFYSGMTGAAYTLIKAGEILGHEEYISKGLEKLNLIADHPNEPWSIDVISGPAGVITALLCLKQYGFAQVAMGLGDYLIETAHVDDTGFSWDTTPRKTRNLTGFAHGSAGIGAALMELYRYSGEDKYLEAGKMAFAYEDNCFIKEVQNWPDYRDMDIKSTIAWCHGAPGILLSRIRAFEITKDSYYREMAWRAINTTISFTKQCMSMNTANFSLCHGVLGNAECILSAFAVLKEGMLLDFVENVGLYVLNGFIEREWPLRSGLRNGEECPGFMMGNAGMGYFYLRLCDPEAVSSVLLLQNTGS